MRLTSKLFVRARYAQIAGVRILLGTLCVLIFSKLTFAQSVNVAANPEDNINFPTSFPTPTPTPFATPTPCPASSGSGECKQLPDVILSQISTGESCQCCPAGQVYGQYGSTDVCVPTQCTSSPRYSQFIYCDSNGVCNCNDGCVVKPIYNMTIREYTGTASVPFRTLASGSFPECLRQIATECGNRWSTEITWSTQLRQQLLNRYLLKDRFNDRARIGTTNQYWALGANETLVSRIKGVTRTVRQPGTVFPQYGTDECVVQAIGGRNDLSTMSIVLDDACQRVTVPEYTCGLNGSLYHDSAWVWYPSPISLLLDKSKTIGQVVNVTKFPLIPGHEGKWYGWKASAGSPLLVRDIGEKGRITEAAELFGNYSFGKEWSNGFEALETLDVNKDKKLTNNELAELSLWFDRNENGISEEGEVSPLAQHGIIALYFKIDKKDEKTGDLYVFNGFDRLVNGKIEHGVAVDWFVTEYSSREEGLLKEQARASNYNTKQKEDLALTDKWSNEENANPEVSNEKSSIADKLFSTAWAWKLKNTIIEGSKVNLSKEQSDVVVGLLTFKGESKGYFSGHSFIELEKPENSSGIRSEVIAYPLAGTIVKLANGNYKLAFSVKAENGLRTNSQAILSADGLIIEGKSEMQLGETRDGKPKIVEYDWNASPVS